MNIYRTYFVLPLLAGTLLMPVISSAADEAPLGSTKSREATGIILGPVLAHPYLTVRESYSDNIYLTPDNEKNDFITTVMPGLQLQMPFGRNSFSVGANASINRYARHSSENTDDWGANAAGDLNFGSRVNLKIADNYIAGHEARNQSATTAVEKFKNNLASGSLTYVLADVSKLQLDYANSYWNYKNSDFRDRDENQLSLYFYYRILPKTSVFGEYEYKNVDFTHSGNSLDNTVHSGMLGLTWELSSRSKGTVKGGVLYKDFVNTSNGNFSTFTASADIAHHFSDFDSIKVVGARGVNETSLQGTRYSVSTGISGEYTHRFLDRLASTLKGSYSKENFSDIAIGETELRKDSVAQLGASMQYSFRSWLSSSLDYYWRNKDSNINYYDSTENNISVTLKASF